MTQQDFRKKLIELKDFFTAEKRIAQSFIFFRADEKNAVMNLEKVLSKFGITGMGTVIAIACACLLEEIEKQEKD